MVKCTISGICHHEVVLARVNSFNKISFITWSQTLQFRGYNIECKQHRLWFAPHSFIFFKICQIVICPVRRTYNHVSIYLCLRTKKAFNLPSQASFGKVKCLYWFQIVKLSHKFLFLARIVKW